jgi:hypothetical protein
MDILKTKANEKENEVMSVQEVVLSIVNRPGELSRIIAHLYENDVTVSAFQVCTENSETVLRFISSDPESAVSILTGLSLEARTSEVIVARIPSHPGGFNSLLKVLATANIDIVHTYPGLDTNDPILVLKVDDPEKAVSALQENWIHLQ